MTQGSDGFHLDGFYPVTARGTHPQKTREFMRAWWFPTEELARAFVRSQGFTNANVFRSLYPDKPWFVNVMD